MRIPPSPPDFETGLQAFGGRLPQLLARGLKPEVDGRYLHWAELRRRTPPEGLTHEEWWLGIQLARKALRTELPLRDGQQRPFHFARTDGLSRALHQIDREMGNRVELQDPQLVNPASRNRYLLSSLREEAITSSQLEGAATTREVAKEMLATNRKPRSTDERMIYNNYQAMEEIRSRPNKPLSPAFLMELHQIITDGTLEPGESGRLRRPDEKIQVQDRGTGDVHHIPPDANELPARLEALCRFANETESDAFIHPVIRAIVLHFMLAYDHPFVDGNGRTARAIFYWSMLQQKYWMAEFLSISRIIQRAPSQYSAAYLHTETDGSDLTYFLMHQVGVIQKAVEELYSYLNRKGAELRDVELQLPGRDINQRQRAVLAHALRNTGAEFLIDAHRRDHNVTYQTARQDLMSLEKAGYLRLVKVGRAFHFHAVPDLEKVLKQHSEAPSPKAPKPRRPRQNRGAVSAEASSGASAKSEAERREDALKTAEEAVALQRELVELNRDAVLPDLAKSLYNLVPMQSDAGRREEALRSSEEAVKLRRELASKDRDAFLPDLAASLNRLTVIQHAMGRREDALRSIEEAVVLRRELANRDRDDFLSELAASLNNLAAALRDVGRLDEGLHSAEEAVALQRELANRDRDAFLTDLAIWLSNLAVMQRDLGHPDESLHTAVEAVELQRELAKQDRDAILPDLAGSLNILAVAQLDLGHLENALQTVEEAVRLLSPYFFALPHAYSRLLTSILKNYRLTAEELGRQPDMELLNPVLKKLSEMTSAGAPS